MTSPAAGSHSAMARKLILKMDISLDGFVGRTDGDVQWVFDGFDDETETAVLEGLWQAGAHLMGRALYHDMAGHWPTATSVYAAPMNEIPKIVFSQSLTETPWGETSVVRGDLATEISALKDQPGDDLLAHGGSRFAQSLSRLGLIDEYRLMVHPLALGDGLPLFGAEVPLKVVERRAFATGTEIVRFVPR